MDDDTCNWRRTAKRTLIFSVAYLALCAEVALSWVTVYENALQEQFKLSQYKVSITTGCTNVGILLSILVGILVRKFGERYTCAGAGLFVSCPPLLMWYATYHKNYFNQHVYLLWLTYFVYGLGFSMGVLSALSAVNRQFPHRYMATVIGLLGTYASVGPIICTTLYDKFFHRGMSYEQQNIRGYFLCLGICSIVIHCAATATYGWPTIWDTDSVNETKHLFPKPQSYHKQHKCANGTTILKEPSTLEDELGKGQHCKELDTQRKTLPQKEVGIADIMYLFRDPRFHLTVWPAGVLTSIKYLGNNNLSVFLRSFKLSKYELLLSYILPMISLVLKPLLGVVADITRHCFSRVWYPLLGGVLLFFSFILAIFYLDHITVFCLVLIFWVMGSEIAFLQPVVHLDDFGKRNFSINMGLLLVSTASCNFLGQLIFGIVYSKRTTDNSICYGLSCFVLTFVAYIVLIIPCVIALMVYIALYTKRD